MSESLLSFSEVLLFGRLVQEIEIKPTITAKAATDQELTSPFSGTSVNGVTVGVGEKILVKDQPKGKRDENGLWTVTGGAGNPWDRKTQYPWGTIIEVLEGGGTNSQKGFWKQIGSYNKGRQKFKKVSKRKGLGKNNQLADQLGDDARIARIYAFAYEGTHYELPEPILMLVHGEGESATDGNKPGDLAARAPNDPSLSGVSAADYQIANDIRVWDYDKADYTMRMDVMTGQFEQVLLDIYFGFDSPAVSGARVSGARVSGARVSGARVSGARVSGARVSGARARGSED
ncbi:hypothetical protein [Ruegeria arenilitoris]|uniref:hypothetical protein n=1 Tax=Ruegeria arenilitoris TaxID=1173585 RepID=UPI001479FD57|nr:hypothetical protein [Ruegeria arenilitoris]